MWTISFFFKSLFANPAEAAKDAKAILEEQ